MDKDINYSLHDLRKIMRGNGIKVKSIEAVRDAYDELAEIVYENGSRDYANISCDSNLAAVYDVLAVVLEIKREVTPVGTIIRNGYERPEDFWESRSDDFDDE